jgi:hypothetical protein
VGYEQRNRRGETEDTGNKRRKKINERGKMTRKFKLYWGIIRPIVTYACERNYKKQINGI